MQLLQQQIIDIIYLPFVTGIVGYLTNKLAIKMLFRPFKPKWYTLGWQGIVPRTRPILANKIAAIVSNKLLSHDDMLKVISKEEFYNYIKNEIQLKLDNINDNDIKNILKNINFKEIVTNNSDFIDKVGYDLVDTLLKKKVTEIININTLPEKISNFAAPMVTNTLSSEITTYINNTINSGKNLENIMPQSILSKKEDIAEYITNIALQLIKSSGNSDRIKEVAAEKIVSLKDSFFGGNGSDILKMGLINMFLNNETIADITKKELPKILDDIANNDEVKKSIKDNIIKEMDTFLSKKLDDLFNNNIINEVNGEIYTKISSNEFKDKLNKSIQNTLSFFVSTLSFMTIKDILKLLSINLENSFNLSKILISFNNNELENKIYSYISTYINNNSEKLSIKLTDNFTASLKTNLPKILHQINIGKTVEDKINNLSLKEVEEMLFSFMKIHFKWINILGFVIGFIIGCIQLSITVMIH